MLRIRWIWVCSLKFTTNIKLSPQLPRIKIKRIRFSKIRLCFKIWRTITEKRQTFNGNYKHYLNKLGSQKRRINLSFSSKGKPQTWLVINLLVKAPLKSPKAYKSYLKFKKTKKRTHNWINRFQIINKEIFNLRWNFSNGFSTMDSYETKQKYKFMEKESRLTFSWLTSSLFRRFVFVINFEESFVLN